jgi:uncharacterized PurR-regulated membrane protein YhhQ (DUF165 family)
MSRPVPRSRRETLPAWAQRWAAPGLERTKAGLAVLSLAVYVGAIAGANWMIAHVGVAVHGSHYLPVGFGLRAPSGVYMAALTFVARDIVQRLAGVRVGVAAIVAGAAISWWVSSPSLAVASGVTFLVSESCDFLVYTPLQAWNFPVAVVGSGLIGDAVDSTLFLTLAGIPLSVALPGQLVGKAWVMLAGGALAALLRRAGPFKSPNAKQGGHNPPLLNMAPAYGSET